MFPLVHLQMASYHPLKRSGIGDDEDGDNVDDDNYDGDCDGYLDSTVMCRGWRGEF